MNPVVVNVSTNTQLAKMNAAPEVFKSPDISQRFLVKNYIKKIYTKIVS